MKTVMSLQEVLSRLEATNTALDILKEHLIFYVANTLAVDPGVYTHLEQQEDGQWVLYDPSDQFDIRRIYLYADGVKGPVAALVWHLKEVGLVPFAEEDQDYEDYNKKFYG